MISRIAYFPYIDGLRAIAVLSVLIYHLNSDFLPGGFAGVDIFFVISGFVVSASAGAFGQLSLPQFLLLFYSRRIKRIAPALIVCLLATTLASALLIPPAWLSDTNQRTGIFAFFGLSNFILAQTSGDYFSPRSEFNPFTQTWSLGVEEQFYLIFPILFFGWIGGRTRLLTAVAFGVGFLASLSWSWYLSGTDNASAYYMITSRFWQLASGALLYQYMISI
jgi:peptidoglycan/LPS O-acetylase OafA/YrhL